MARRASQPRPNLVAEPAGLTVTATKSILGAIRAGEFVDVEAFDSIVDATDPTNVAIAALDGTAGVGSLTLGTAATPGEIPSGCTVVGKVHAVLLSSRFEQHRLGGDNGGRFLAHGPDRRPQAGGLRALQLPARGREDAAPLSNAWSRPSPDRSLSSSHCATDVRAT